MDEVSTTSVAQDSAEFLGRVLASYAEHFQRNPWDGPDSATGDVLRRAVNLLTRQSAELEELRAENAAVRIANVELRDDLSTSRDETAGAEACIESARRMEGDLRAELAETKARLEKAEKVVEAAENLLVLVTNLGGIGDLVSSQDIEADAKEGARVLRELIAALRPAPLATEKG